MSLSCTLCVVAVTRLLTCLRSNIVSLQTQRTRRFLALETETTRQVNKKGRTYRDVLHVSLLEYLHDAIVLLVCAELVLQRRLGRRVHVALGAVLVRHHDLERVDHLREWDRAVALPRLEVLFRLNVNDEVVRVALVVDFGDGAVSTRHGWMEGGFVVEGFVGVFWSMCKRLFVGVRAGTAHWGWGDGLLVIFVAWRSLCRYRGGIEICF